VKRIKRLLSKKPIQLLPFILVLLAFIISRAWNFNTNPLGFFCDEAEIGHNSYLLLKNGFTQFVTPLFYRHFEYIFGALPVYATSPFVYIFGLNEFSVRLSTLFYSVLCLIVLYLILKKIKSYYPVLIILYFAFTPIYFHFSKPNFGLMPSFLFILLSYYLFLFINNKKKSNIIYPFLSGACLGISAYGYGGYLITSALFFLILLLTLILKNIRTKKNIKYTLFFIFSFCFVYTPIVLAILFNNAYISRINQKDESNKDLNVKKRIVKVILNYPKYYSLDYLFFKGEIDMNGGYVKRHSIQGNGELYRSSLPIILSALVLYVFFDKDKKRKRLYLPFFLLFLAYPFSDVLTTNYEEPPYSISVFTTIFFLPFMVSYVFAFIKKNRRILNNKKKVIAIFILLIFLIEAIFFLINNNKYPAYSSGYFGWQYGYKPVMEIFEEKERYYDELLITHRFNRGEVLLSFYNTQINCRKCRVMSNPIEIDSNKKQLFALRKDDINEAKERYKGLEFKIKKRIYLPDGTAEIFIGEFAQAF